MDWRRGLVPLWGLKLWVKAENVVASDKYTDTSTTFNKPWIKPKINTITNKNKSNSKAIKSMAKDNDGNNKEEITMMIPPFLPFPARTQLP